LISYLLSKLLPLWFLPLGLSLILLFLAWLFGWRWSSLLAFALLWIFSLGIVAQGLWRLLEAPWQRRLVSSAPSADAIVVLSGALHPAPGIDRVTEWADPDRFLAGLDLYRANKAPRLLFTGGSNPFQPGLLPEGQQYIKHALALGIPVAAMASTPPVVNTAEEAAAIRQLLKSVHPTSSSRILLVTSAFHMRRAQRLFERQGVNVVPFPVDFKARGAWAGPLWRDPLQWLPTAGSLRSSSTALRELLGRFVYRAW
jgi:uncharacterized SAM-binding protein YcdF (DUF218 family)